MDEKTIDNARCGDRRAQAQILRELQDPWFRFCLGLLGDGDRARDATQETAVRFLQRLPTWRGDGTLKTWSFGIALNVVREMRRKGATIDPSLTAGPGRAGSLPADSAERAERSQLLHDALMLLPERQREALMLRFFENLTTQETANAMHCAVGTVKATVHQALRTLRSKLRQLT